MPNSDRHIDSSTLALLALGENGAAHDEREHLARCSQCADELEQLTATVTVGRATQHEGELVSPDPRVWSAIHNELGLAAGVQPETVATTSDQTPPVSLDAQRLKRRPGTMFLIAAVTVFALVVGGGLVWQLVRTAGTQVLAEATLDAFPEWQSASGAAVVQEGAGGAREVTVTVDTPGVDDGYREVWLIRGDASGLVSLGVLAGDTGTFAIPEGIDIDEYSLVDISREPLDGDPAHSGDSILRGELS